MSILLAMVFDAQFGELPSRIHPVVWIGHYLRLAGRGITRLPPLSGFLAGMLLWLAGAFVFTAFFWVAENVLRTSPLWFQWLSLGLLLKPLFALRLLIREVSQVEEMLSLGLPEGRRQLSRIVSRDTSRLSPAEVRESALESLSENLSDSVVAPLFWFSLFGLPGAALYRFANTADAMWGYRGKWEWAGKWAARADDVLNLVPARLTAFALFCTRPAAFCRAGECGLEAAKTPSPNSGWPMSALALAHGIRLGKPGVYVLNPGGAGPDPAVTADCIRHVKIAGWSASLVFSILSFATWRFLHG